MKAARRQIIKEMFQAKPFVSLKELQDRFPEVTSMTLRRDIEFFEKQGELIKVRNGARSMKFITTSMEEEYDLREKENSEAKLRIAKCAVELIEMGRSIFLDSGTTTMRLAELLPDRRLTITTSGPNIALELAKKNLPLINLVGGMVNRDNISVSGSQAVAFLENVNIDIAFMVPSGYSAKNGFSCGNYSECELKSYIAQKARYVVMLMDASKIDKSLPYTFCKLDRVNTLILDKPISQSLLNASDYPNLRIVLAGDGGAPMKEHMTRCLPREL
jgi:Transcriptional regulators of sugar metabolism